MAFAPGDRVHIATLATGIVRVVRNGGRHLVEVKGKIVVVDGSKMDHAVPPPSPRSASFMAGAAGGSGTPSTGASAN